MHLRLHYKSYYQLIFTTPILQKTRRYHSHQSHQNLQSRRLSLALAVVMQEEVPFSLLSFLLLLNIISPSSIILGFGFTSPGALISGITSLDHSSQIQELYLIFKFRCPGRSFAEKCMLRLPILFKLVKSSRTSRQVSSCCNISISRGSTSSW